MTDLIWGTIAVAAAVLFLLCIEIIVCLKNDIWEKEKLRLGSVTASFKISIFILLIFGILISGINADYSKNEQYFQETFPLVVKGDAYLQDMVFVEPQNSDLYEVYGYSEMERLLITRTKDTHEIHYYPDTDIDIFEILATTPINMDEFLLKWANGEWSPYP